jgi:hypothetical protein
MKINTNCSGAECYTKLLLNSVPNDLRGVIIFLFKVYRIILILNQPYPCRVTVFL